VYFVLRTHDILLKVTVLADFGQVKMMNLSFYRFPFNSVENTYILFKHNKLK